MGDLGFALRQAAARNGAAWSRCSIAALQAAIADVRTSGLNIMMSMKEEGKPISFVEDCAVPLITSRTTRARLTRGVREARHARHLVRARLGRLPACAPGAEPAAGEGREGDARHRRGSLRDGARLQGLAFGRARRRHRALGIPRVDVRQAARAGLRGGEGHASTRRACSIPARSCARRNSTTARTSATGRSYRGAGDEDRARLVGLAGRGRRFPGRGRDVQQQRRLPQDRAAA